MGLGNPSLKVKIMIESNPLTSRICLRRLDVAGAESLPSGEPSADAAPEPLMWCFESLVSHASSSPEVFVSFADTVITLSR